MKFAESGEEFRPTKYSGMSRSQGTENWPSARSHTLEYQKSTAQAQEFSNDYFSIIFSSPDHFLR